MQDNRTKMKEDGVDGRMDDLMTSIAQIRKTISEYGVSENDLMSVENEEDALPSHLREEAIRAFKRSRTTSEPAVDEAIKESSLILENARKKAGEMLDDAEKKVSVLLRQAEVLKEEAEAMMEQAEEDSRSIRTAAEDQAARIREEGSRAARENQRKILAENNQLRLDVQKEAEDIHKKAVEEATEILYQAEQEIKRKKEEAQADSVEGLRKQAEEEAERIRKEAQEEAVRIKEEAEKEAHDLVEEANASNRRMVQEACQLLENTKEQANGLLEDAKGNAEKIVEEATKSLPVIEEKTTETPEVMPVVQEEVPFNQKDVLVQDLCLLGFLGSLLLGGGWSLLTTGNFRETGLAMSLCSIVPALFATYRFEKTSWGVAGLLAIGYGIYNLAGVVTGRMPFAFRNVFFTVLPLLTTFGMNGFVKAVKRNEEENSRMKKLLEDVDVQSGVYGQKRLEKDLECFREKGNVKQLCVRCTNMDMLQVKLKENGTRRFLQQWCALLEETVTLQGRVYAMEDHSFTIVVPKGVDLREEIEKNLGETGNFEEAAAKGILPQFEVSEE